MPCEKHSTVPVGINIEWTGSNVGLLKNSETGETIVHIRAADRSIVEKEFTVSKCKVEYYFDDWPHEDILTFLAYVVAEIEALVERTYAAFPNGFTFPKGGIASTKNEVLV